MCSYGGIHGINVSMMPGSVARCPDSLTPNVLSRGWVPSEGVVCHSRSQTNIAAVAHLQLQTLSEIIHEALSACQRKKTHLPENNFSLSDAAGS